MHRPATAMIADPLPGMAWKAGESHPSTPSARTDGTAGALAIIAVAPSRRLGMPPCGQRMSAQGVSLELWNGSRIALARCRMLRRPIVGCWRRSIEKTS